MRQRMRRLSRSMPAATLRTRRSDGVAGSNAKTLSSGRTGHPSNMTDDFQNLVPVCQRPPGKPRRDGRRDPLCKYNDRVAKRMFAGYFLIKKIIRSLKKSALPGVFFQRAPFEQMTICLLPLRHFDIYCCKSQT